MAQKEILKTGRRCSMLTLDDDARHNTRQREESGTAPVDYGGTAGRGARRGFFGTAAVELSVQDGTIQHIRRMVERVEK